MPTNFASLDGEKLLTTLQEECTRNGVSDIHISPEKNDVRLEWRLHGVLLPLARITHPNYVKLIRRVKFESKLKLNVTNIPQDGQYTFTVSEPMAGGGEPKQTAEDHERSPAAAGRSRMVNVRVATIPSRFGETLTLRLLDPKRGIIPLEKLGFPGDIREKLAGLVELPHGLILVTGPTGSGKTTTLYALLSTVIGKERNIITLEDPVEYELAGIVQSEMDAEHDYNFANGLRSILRHDPDVILVGEIRDLETAQTAVNASLTGHVVLSTLHTNSAIEAIHRMLSMGVSPYTLAPALRAILAQRLIRTVKPECKVEGATCDPAANDTYDGQMCLPELLMVTEPIRQAILNFDSAANILELAKKEGYKTMREWGDELVKDKRTMQMEIDRVCM